VRRKILIVETYREVCTIRFFWYVVQGFTRQKSKVHFSHLCKDGPIIRSAGAGVDKPMTLNSVMPKIGMNVTPILFLRVLRSLQEEEKLNECGDPEGMHISCIHRFTEVPKKRQRFIIDDKEGLQPSSVNSLLMNIFFPFIWTVVSKFLSGKEILQ